MSWSFGSRVPARRLVVAVSVLSSLLMTSCGGGGGDGLVTKSPTPNPLTVQGSVTSFASTVGQAITPFTAIVASGGTTPYTYAATGLPDGLSIDAASGTISGTPTQTQQVSASLSVTDKNGTKSSSVSVSFAINARPTMTVAGGNGGNPPQVSCLVGASNCVFPAITASSGTTPFTYSIQPTLPVGLTLNPSTGAITGAAAGASGTTLYTLTLTDKSGATATATFNLTVASLVLTPTLLEVGCGETNGCNPRIDTLKFTASSGTAPYVYTSTTMPNGVTLASSTGQLSGTISAGLAPTTVTLTAIDAQSRSATASITFSALYTTYVAGNAMTCTRAVACSASTLNAGATGKQPYTYSISSGALPTGLTINASTGAISGTGTVSGTSTLTVRATDALGRTSEKAFAVTVQEPALSTTVAVAEFACGETNGCAPTAPFTPVTATGGITPYTYSVAPALPTGMTLNTSTGAISGAPTSALAQTNFTLTVQDNATPTKATSSKSFAISALYTTVAASTACPISQACNLTPVSANLSGKAPYTYTITTGALPSGITLNASTGAITGTSATASSTSITVRVTDALGRTSDKTFTFSVANQALALTQAIAAVAYGRESGWKGATSPFTPVTATGGTTPYTFSMSGLGLPTGLTLSASTGAISGNPVFGVDPGTYTVRVTDAATPFATATQTFSLSSLYISAAASTITCTVAQVCAATPVAATSVARTPLTYSVVNGTLPAGLTLNGSTGAISGAATGTGTALVKFRVTDALLASDTASVTFSIVAPFYATTVIAEASCGETNGCWNSRDGVFSGPFTPVTVTNAVGPVTYAVTPALPSALTLNTATGAISGAAPYAMGVLPPTVYLMRATDQTGRVAESTFSLNGITSVYWGNVNCRVPWPCTWFPVTTNGAGKPPFTYSTTGLPPGLSLNASTGQITGTPTSSGDFAINGVFINDANGRTSGKAFVMTIYPFAAETFRVTVQTPEYGCGDNGCTSPSPFTPVTASGEPSPYRFARAIPLPSSLSLNTSTGVITGTLSTPMPQTDVAVVVYDADNFYDISGMFRVSKISAVLTTSNPNTTCQTTVPCSFIPVTPNGTGKYPWTYSVTGTLPAGLTLNASTGLLAGTPTVAGSSVVTITVTDALGRTSSKQVTFTVR